MQRGQAAAQRIEARLRPAQCPCQRVLLGGDAAVGDDRAEFLRQSGLVEHGAALAFQVRGHAEQRADGENSGAADTADCDIVGLVQCGPRGRLRQLTDVGEFRGCAVARLASARVGAGAPFSSLLSRIRAASNRVVAIMPCIAASDSISRPCASNTGGLSSCMSLA